MKSRSSDDLEVRTLNPKPVSYPNYYAMDDSILCVKLIQYKTENLSLKTCQMEEVEIFF
jgi:hypothetical protein